ncbi:MAG: hypothetical protein RMY32_001650, partial [Nostoc sp. ChiSLP03a]|nr:hypothetical protein [Nostoc sp. ChiSLP03a]
EDTVCRRFFSSSSLSAIAILNGRLMVLLTYLVCFSPLYADSFLIGITGAGTHPGGSISGLPGRNCARVFLHNEQPIAQKIKEAGGSIKSAFASVLRNELD